MELATEVDKARVKLIEGKADVIKKYVCTIILNNKKNYLRINN